MNASRSLVAKTGGAEGDTPKGNRIELEALSGRRLAISLVAWIAGSAVLGLSTYATARALAAAGQPSAQVLGAWITLEVYALLVATLLLAPRGRGGVAATYGLWPRVYYVALGMATAAALVAAVMIGYAVAGAWSELSQSLVWIGRDGGRLGSVDPVTSVASIARGVLLAPLGEELLFRGALFGWLRKRLPVWAVVFATAALWTAAHFGLPAALPYVFVVGIFLGVLRHRTASIIPGLAVHVTHNAILFAAVFVFAGWT